MLSFWYSARCHRQLKLMICIGTCLLIYLASAGTAATVLGHPQSDSGHGLTSAVSMEQSSFLARTSAQTDVRGIESGTAAPAGRIAAVSTENATLGHGLASTRLYLGRTVYGVDLPATCQTV